MQITFACGSMPFGPETPTRASLGGSETAALMLAKAVAARGHEVTMFCNLPPQGRPDAFQSGQKASDGVRYVDLSHYQSFVTVNPCDVLVVVRDPGLISVPAQAKKKVLWMHDIATRRGMQRALEQMAFTFDEIWAVSEWHKNQIAETTGYPEDRIVAIRNGIVKYDDIIPFGRSEKTLIYASRPERGLENLVKPGGVMEHLPDFKLVVAMYNHFPDHMKDFYEYIFACMKRLPNVEFVGDKPNAELRQIIADSTAYVYPSQFEETSCILARECLEQGTPFLTTSMGAVPETLGDEGIYFEDYLFAMGVKEPERGSPGWCQLFALFVKDALSHKDKLEALRERMQARTDLYWDGVAEMIETQFEPPRGTAFSRIFSLLQDGDALAARAYYQSLPEDTMGTGKLAEEFELYNFANGDLAAYYEDLYRSKLDTEDNELQFKLEPGGQRHVAIAEQIAANLPPGSKIFEYGCGPGHLLGPLARYMPDREFIGYDLSKSAADVVNAGAGHNELKNLYASANLSEFEGEKFDAVICSEVLEHVVEPWKLLEQVEGYCKPGGLVILTTPFGPWETATYQADGGKRWKERAHLWAIDKQMMTEMCDGPKPDQKCIMVIAHAQTEWMRPLGNYLFTYRADHRPTKPIDPLSKALRHWPRETCAAVIIAYNNEDVILRLLNSLDKKVQFVQIAMGPSTDKTEELVVGWFEQHPWMRYNLIDVPRIEAYKFGFDDARNASTKDIDLDCEWMLWIDTDEYLSGEIRKYLRPSAIDGYLVSQHHFTVEPRGNPPEIDKPARLIRTDRGYKAYGHIHEHFEIPAGGPGRCMLLPDIDIGHPGYVNEGVRQARFFRNFPFLAWEHETNPDRKLHRFLWFRDLIHRMRFAPDPVNRVALANEAVTYYNDNQKEMGEFGPGLFVSLLYLREALIVLGRGVDLKVAIHLDDRNAVIEGRFENYEQFERVQAQLLKEEFKVRTDRYW